MPELKTIIDEPTYRKALIAALSRKSGVPASNINGSTEPFESRASGGLGFDADADPFPKIYKEVAEDLLGKAYLNYFGDEPPVGGPTIDSCVEEGSVWTCDFGVRAGIDVIRKALRDESLDFSDALNFTGGTSNLSFPGAVQKEINDRMRFIPDFFFTALEQGDLRNSELVRDAYNVFISIALR